MPRRLLAYDTPDSLTGLTAWLKADSLLLSDADPVTSWLDSSGSGNTATQGTGGAQPSFRTNVLNGKPVVRFDGNDRLTFATESNFDIAKPTMLIVAKRTAGSSGSLLAKNTTDFGDGRRRKLQMATGASSFVYGSGSDGQSINVAATPTNWNMYGLIANSETNHSLFVNGTETISATFTDDDNFNNATMEIGSAFSNGAESFTGDIAEIIIYNRALSSIEMTGVQNYLKAKYDLVTSSTLGAAPRSALTNRRGVKDFGTCLSFDGVDDQVTVSNPGINVTSFSVSWWAHTSTQDGDDAGWHDHLSLAGASGGLLVAEIAGSDGQLHIFRIAGFSGVLDVISTSGDIRNKGWRHFCLTASTSGNVANLYMNSVLIGTNTWAPASEAISTFCIGNRSGSGTRFVTAKMDEVFLFTTPLTQGQVTALYVDNVVPSSIAVKYLFDEGSGTSATDSSGNGKTGTISGATYSTDVVNKARVLASGDIVP